MIEVLGFAGSALIVISLTMKSIVRLRIVGVIGALAFVAYGVSLQAWPVVATNCVTFSIHVVHLRRLRAESMAERDAEQVHTPLDPSRALASTVG